MSCQKCGKCCKSTNSEKRVVIVYPSDLENIVKQFKMSKKVFVEKYCELDYIQCDEDIIINIYILKNMDERCIFLSKNNLCEIYHNRPIQCREAPYNYFAYEEIWNHMPCFDQEKIINENSEEIDKKLVMELLKGYDI